MTATQLPFLARLGIHVGVIGSLASLAVGVGTAVDASARIGLYAVTTAGSEQLGIGVGGIQGPTFTRNGSAVDTTLPGDVVISGNLTVSGTTTTINSTVVNVQDKVLSVAYTAGANVAVPAVIAGITVYRGAIASVARDSAGLFWDETNSAWKFALNTGNDNSTLGAAQAVVMAGLTATTGSFTTLTSSGVLSAQADADAIHSIGYGRLGLASSGTAADFYIGITGHFTSTDYGIRIKAAGDVVANAPTGRSVALRINNSDVLNVQSTAISIAQGAASSGSSTGLTWTGGAHTTLTTGTEAMDWDWNGARTVQFATTTPATQRQYRFRAATYACDSVSQTITTAATVTISGAPAAGTNVTITTPLALWVASGASQFAAVTASSMTNSSLTSGRVALVGTAGLMSDSATYTYSTSSGTLSVGDGVTVKDFTLVIDGPAGNNRDISFRTGGSLRWLWRVSSTAEAGSDAGSNLQLLARTDAGAAIDTPISLNRVSGGTLTIARPTTISTGAFTVTSGAVSVTNGATSLQLTDSATNATTTLLTLTHLSSGTPAANFATRLLFNGHSDNNTNRNMAYLNAAWVVATDASRQSKLDLIAYNVGTAVNLLSLSATASTYGTATVSGILSIADFIAAYDTSFTAPTIYASASTGGAYPFLEAGNLIIQPRISGATRDVIITTAATAADFRFDRNGTLQISRSLVAGTTPAVITNPTITITGGVTDGMLGAIRFSPTYDAATALTVTRHNYIDVNDVALTGVGPAALTDACVIRYNAGVGTHKALAAATTKTTPGGVDGWEKKNINGTIMYSPLYLSKTA